MTREELEKLDSTQLITLLLELIAENAQLKKQLGQNSSNSSKPSSSDGYSKPSPKSLRKKSGKRVGGQKGHKGHGIKLTREPDVTIELIPDICAYCGESLQGTEVKVIETRYEYGMVSVARTQTLMRALLEISIRIGSIQQMVKQ